MALALSSNKIALIRRAISRANANAPIDNNLPPLFWAIKWNRMQWVHLLLYLGADPSLILHGDGFVTTPLSMSLNQPPAMMELLLAKGAFFDKKTFLRLLELLSLKTKWAHFKTLLYSSQQKVQHVVRQLTLQELPFSWQTCIYFNELMGPLSFLIKSDKDLKRFLAPLPQKERADYLQKGEVLNLLLHHIPNEVCLAWLVKELTLTIDEWITLLKAFFQQEWAQRAGVLNVIFNNLPAHQHAALVHHRHMRPFLLVWCHDKPIFSDTALHTISQRLSPEQMTQFLAQEWVLALVDNTAAFAVLSRHLPPNQMKALIQSHFSDEELVSYAHKRTVPHIVQHLPEPRIRPF